MAHHYTKCFIYDYCLLTGRSDVVQHVSHFSHLGLIAFDFILLLGRFDNRPGLVPITGTVVAGHPATGRTVGNSVKPKQQYYSDDERNNNQ